MIMCWLTPKSFDGSSEKLEIARFELCSQSESDNNGEVENEEDDGGRWDATLYNNGDVEEVDRRE